MTEKSKFARALHYARQMKGLDSGEFVGGQYVFSTEHSPQEVLDEDLEIITSLLERKGYEIIDHSQQTLIKGPIFFVDIKYTGKNQ